MCIKTLKCLVLFFLLSTFSSFAGYALDEDGTMGSENIDDFDDEGESTEDRTLAPNEYEGDASSGGDVEVGVEIPLGGSGDAGND